MSKMLIVLSFLFLIGAVHAVAAENKTPPKPAPAKSKPSSTIPDRREFPLSNEVGACTDFHKYVCSGAESSFKLRPDRSSHTFAFSDSHERILEKKKEFFTKIDQEKNLPPRAQQFVAFYKACMNTKARAKEEREQLAALVKELGGIKTVKDFVTADQDLMLKGRISIMNLYNTNNTDNSDKLDLGTMLSFMQLPDQSYYEKPEVVADYKALLVDFFKTAYPSLSKKDINAKVERLYAFELEFAKAYPKRAERRDRWSEKRFVPQAQILKDYPLLQMEKLLSKVSPDTFVHIPYPEAHAYYNTKATDTNLDVLKDALLYATGSSIMDEGYPKFFKKKFVFYRKHFGGPEKRSDLQERCTKLTQNSFEKEVDEVMMARLFPNFPEEKMQAVAAKVRGAIVSGLEKNKWLSSDARKMAIKKMATARLQIIKPNNEREWNFNPLQEYSASEYLLNQQKLASALLERGIKETYEPANKDKWEMGPLTVNAYYSPTENKFVMPMGILQFPFFDPEGSLIENLGAVGAVVGHELGHGIDDQGSKYNDKGNLQPWMGDKDLKEFGLRGEKLITQFNAIKHDGRLTLGENIGDLVGLTFAYNAAFPDGKGSVEDQQKFFVSYARVWCFVARPGMLERQLKTDPHALGFARINEQVKHQPAFAKAFSCKPGDAMTLKDDDRVSIW
jgi:putative endopeptidase